MTKGNQKPTLEKTARKYVEAAKTAKTVEFSRISNFYLQVMIRRLEFLSLSKILSLFKEAKLPVFSEKTEIIIIIKLFGVQCV